MWLTVQFRCLKRLGSTQYMKWKLARRASMLYGISALVMLGGLSSAFLIYRAAGRASPGYASGVLFDPEYSEQDLRELERYGGEANVLAYEVRLWFVGLWHGKPLACIVSCVTVLLSLGCAYVADHPP